MRIKKKTLFQSRNLLVVVVLVLVMFIFLSGMTKAEEAPDCEDDYCNHPGECYVCPYTPPCTDESGHNICEDYCIISDCIPSFHCNFCGGITPLFGLGCSQLECDEYFYEDESDTTPCNDGFCSPWFDCSCTYPNAYGDCSTTPAICDPNDENYYCNDNVCNPTDDCRCQEPFRFGDCTDPLTECAGLSDPCSDPYCTPNLDCNCPLSANGLFYGQCTLGECGVGTLCDDGERTIEDCTWCATFGDYEDDPELCDQYTAQCHDGICEGLYGDAFDCQYCKVNDEGTMWGDCSAARCGLSSACANGECNLDFYSPTYDCACPDGQGDCEGQCDSCNDGYCERHPAYNPDFTDCECTEPRMYGDCDPTECGVSSCSDGRCVPFIDCECYDYGDCSATNCSIGQSPDANYCYDDVCVAGTDCSCTDPLYGDCTATECLDEGFCSDGSCDIIECSVCQNYGDCKISQCFPSALPADDNWLVNKFIHISHGRAIYPSETKMLLKQGDAEGTYITQSQNVLYNIFGEPKEIRDALGNTKLFTYSICGVIASANSLYPEGSTVYNDYCLPIEVYDANNQKIGKWYDVLNRVERIVTPLDTYESPTTRYVSHFGNPSEDDNFVATYSKLDADGYVQKRALYDGIGRSYMTRTIPDSGDVIESLTNFYDETGLVYKTSKPYYQSEGVDPDGWTVYYYTPDPLRQVSRVDPPGDGDVVVSFDNVNNMLKTIHSDENAIQTISYTDAYENLRKVEDAHEKTWEYEYDAFGNVISVTPPDGAAVHIYQYDSLGRVIAEFDPEKGVIAGSDYTDLYEYDQNGNLRFHTTALGVKETRYDVLNRPTVVKYSVVGGEQNVPVLMYYYDGTGRYCLNDNQFSKGKLCVVRRIYPEREPGQNWEDQSSRSFGYDEEGRIIEEEVSIRKPDATYVEYSILYEYDRAGNVVQETINDETRYTFHYDALGRLHDVYLQVSDDGFGGGQQPTSELVATFSYEPTSAIASITYGNGVTATYEYTEQEWLKSLDIAGASASFQRSYVYDNVGNIEELYGAVTPTNLLASYDYDDLYRLTAVTDAGYYGTSYSYLYDALGNRVQENTGSLITYYDYDITQNNQLEQVRESDHFDEPTSFFYDSHGSLVAKEGNDAVTYVYEPFDDLLVAVDLNTDGEYDMQFTYDEAGRRITKQTNDGFVVYLRDISGNTVLVDEVGWGS